MAHFSPGDRVVALDYSDRRPLQHGSIIERNPVSEQFWFVLFDGYLEPWGHHGNYLTLEPNVPRLADGTWATEPQPGL